MPTWNMTSIRQARPTRVNHVVSGAEYYKGAGKYPEFYADTLPATLNIGPGSPTGARFGYGAQFPKNYQEAFYVLDWSWGKIYAVHLEEDGSSYRATKEEFITGAPLPVTDIIIHPQDRAMYFTIGGRRVQSGLYRVTQKARRHSPSYRQAAQLPAFHRKSLRRFTENRTLRPSAQHGATWIIRSSFVCCSRALD